LLIIFLMKCPFCSTNLRQIRSNAASIDTCPECGGVWFDKGKFLPVAKMLAASDKIKPEKIKLFYKRDVKNLYAVKEEARLCPKCNLTLKRFNYSGDSNVFLDKCPECGGIWADGKEIYQVASYLKEDPETTAVGRRLAEIVKATNPEPLADDKNSIPVYFMFLPRIIIPFADDTPRQRLPIVTISLIGLCVLAFLGQMFLVRDPESFLQVFGFVPANFFSIGLISSMLLHGSILHLGFNMLFLWLFGDNVEDKFGRLGYVWFCLGAGLFASLMHGIFSLNSTTPTIGASGFISGVMGAYLVFYPSANVKMFCFYRIIEVPVIVYFSCWFAMQIISAFLSADGSAGGVAWYAHIGGFLFGVVAAFIEKRRIEES